MAREEYKRIVLRATSDFSTGSDHRDNSVTPRPPDGSCAYRDSVIIFTTVPPVRAAHSVRGGAAHVCRSQSQLAQVTGPTTKPGPAARRRGRTSHEHCRYSDRQDP